MITFNIQVKDEAIQWTSSNDAVVMTYRIDLDLSHLIEPDHDLIGCNTGVSPPLGIDIEENVDRDVGTTWAQASMLARDT